jgi:hypothetical protein
MSQVEKLLVKEAKATEKDAAKAAKDAEKVAEKAAAKAANDAKKDAVKAAKDAKKAAEDVKKAAEAAEKEAVKAAKDAEKAAKDAKKATEAAEKEAVKAAKESEANRNKEWEHIFDTNNIGQDTKFSTVITSKQIDNCSNTWKGKRSKFESRLLCKMDTQENRPAIFKHYRINIISISNGSYLLTKSNIYHPLVYDEQTQIQRIHRYTKSLILSIGKSETSVRDNLRYSGIFETDTYLNEKIECGPLLNGRHFCTFDTHLQDEPIKVCGSQYETDGCYESENKILLIEGKNGNNQSFNIRQLYYPFRTIYDHTKGKKEIIPIFINTDNAGIIHIWKFVFENPLVMTSIRRVTYNKYQFV